MVVWQPVKADSLTLPIPLEELRVLPDGAAYTARSGRAHATATVRRQQGKTATVYIETGCDSLERQVIYYAEENERLQRAATQTQSDSRKEATAQGKPSRKALYTFIAGLVAGIISTIITRRICQKMF